MELDDWVAALGRELGVEPADIDVAAILDLARDAAHGIARPAAPLTTFLAGYAAGLAGGGPAAIAAAITTAVAQIDRDPEPGS
jgi:hypothetical protein